MLEEVYEKGMIHITVEVRESGVGSAGRGETGGKLGKWLI